MSAIRQGTQQSNCCVLGNKEMAPLDFTHVLKDAPVGEWIALSSGSERIVATATSLDDAIAAAKAKGENNPIMMKVPPVSALVL